MSFDGSFTHSIKNELQNMLSTGRVSKINQPYANELILTIRAHGHNHQLLLSANPTYARVQITDIPYSNPRVPNNFTMVIRKYLSGAILNQVSQLDNDRVLYFDFTSRNELGDLQNLRLIVEIMARHSNIILIDPKENKILDAIKHVGSDVNRYRMILPGATYINPPKQDLVNPFSMENFEIISQLVHDFPNVDVLAQELKHHIQGLGNETALALADTLHQNNNYKENFISFFEKFNNPKPTLSEKSNNKLDFSAFPYQIDVKNKYFDSLSNLLDAYFKDNSQRERVREQGATLIHVIKNQLKKNRNKLKKLTKELKETDKADGYRVKGEILTTYLYKVNRGMTSVELENFYDNNAPIKIDLSNQLSPSENAQKYFKHYQKLKNAITYLNEQIDITKKEINYFENIQSQIEIADPKDLIEIRYELEQQGYLKNHEQHKKKHKVAKQKINKPETFYASDGTIILVGKNNLQNDQLTLHTADKRDTWLHTKNIPGSHVIIKDFDPSEETIIQAASLAAYFSKARDSSKVPVDYVKVKQIRKPNGSKPGFVIYEGQNTVIVDPDEEIVNSLTKKDNH